MLVFSEAIIPDFPNPSLRSAFHPKSLKGLSSYFKIYFGTVYTVEKKPSHRDKFRVLILVAPGFNERQRIQGPKAYGGNAIGAVQKSLNSCMRRNPITLLPFVGEKLYSFVLSYQTDFTFWLDPKSKQKVQGCACFTQKPTSDD